MYADAFDRRAHGRIGVDFDGVLAERESGKPLPGAIAALRSLAARWSVVIYTQRPYEADEWLREHGVRHLVEKCTSNKPSVWLYIDDRGLRFEGDWTQTLADVDRLTPPPLPPEPELPKWQQQDTLMAFDAYDDWRER